MRSHRFISISKKNLFRAVTPKRAARFLAIQRESPLSGTGLARGLSQSYFIVLHFDLKQGVGAGGGKGNAEAVSLDACCYVGVGD